MKDTRRLALAVLVLGLAACVMAGASWREARRNLAATLRQTGETSQTSLGAAPTASPEWLNGTTDERFGRVERHLRGMDQAMAEIGYRYGELLVALCDHHHWLRVAHDRLRVTPTLSETQQIMSHLRHTGAWQTGIR